MHISFFKQGTILIVAATIVCNNLWGQQINTVTGKTLIESCKKDPINDSFKTCVAYVQGFLDASPHVVQEEQIASEYVLRAIKTRVPKKDLVVKTISNAKYCVPKEGLMADLVQKISEIQYNHDKHQSPSSLIQAVLKTSYSCNP